MRRVDPNRQLLLGVAEALGDLRDELVFVGGCAPGMLLTDPAASGIRPTQDVDAVAAQATTRIEFHRLQERLAERGFAPDASSDVICRWRHRESGNIFDLMPTDESILGFTNRWYAEAIRTATNLELAQGVSINLISAPAFIATKLEAFIGRGQRDIYSHDLEDILVVVDGRPELVDEMRVALPEL